MGEDKGLTLERLPQSTWNGKILIWVDSEMLNINIIISRAGIPAKMELYIKTLHFLQNQKKDNDQF